MVEAYYTDEFGDWYDTLDETDQGSVDDKVDLLEVGGVSLGRPHTGTIKTSHHAMRELVVQSKGRPLAHLLMLRPAQGRGAHPRRG